MLTNDRKAYPMRCSPQSWIPALAGIATFVFGPVAEAQDGFKTRADRTGAGVSLTFPATVALDGKQVRPKEFVIFRSQDLKVWEAQPQIVVPGPADEELQVILPSLAARFFYRISAVLDSGAIHAAALDPFGYGKTFAVELSGLGQISPNEFYGLFHPTHQPLPGISFDPTTALFWEAYDSSKPNSRLYDFRLNGNEKSLLMTNGFVVSERLGSDTFGNLYYRIYSDDLPVFITTDSILQAWHRSFDSMLEEIEEGFAAPVLQQVLASMALRIPDAIQAYGSGPLETSLQDADYFLSVARALVTGGIVTYFQQSNEVSQALKAIEAGNLQQAFPIFGARRDIDFSQFKPRGHYDTAESLRQYFKAMMWLGRIDLRIGGDFPEQDERELGTAIVLTDLLKRSGQWTNWEQIDAALKRFIGISDSMNPPQLADFLTAQRVFDPASVGNQGDLSRLRDKVLAGSLGEQEIRGDVYYSPFGPAQMTLPRSFSLMGQRFVLDSWALSKVVYDSILWDTNGIPEEKDKVQRRLLSGLDVAFSVLGNNSPVSDLTFRMTNANGLKFRDNLPYQHNLAAVRRVIDRQSEESWDVTMYQGWLSCLRALSPPLSDRSFPEAMRTTAWAYKDLNSQLASWTELRHDTVLYAKPSYTGNFLCIYPAGFVEPRTNLWDRLRQMALQVRATVGGIRFRGSVPFRPYGIPTSWDSIADMQVQFLTLFADRMATLLTISEKELRQEPLNANEIAFLKTVLEDGKDSYAKNRYSGWYPALFYVNRIGQNSLGLGARDGADKVDALVMDVHTDPPQPELGDPGYVLEEATGNVNLLVIAVDNGPDRMIYAGPVFSYYEFASQGIVRKNDTEWQLDLQARRIPAPPEWTKQFLAR